jgi:GNAT superfamily N-acetyltransferase
VTWFLRDPLEAYIERALTEEIDRIPSYYGERDGGFWVAVKGDKVVGTFGLERASDDAMELRRMYVDPLARRQGIARQMLQLAEEECRRRNVSRLEPSTAEIQQAALALYRNAAYCFQLMRCDDSRLFQEWVLQWRGLGVRFEIVPVVPSEETQAVIAPYLDPSTRQSR